MKQPMVFASSNTGKQSEIRARFKSLPYDIQLQTDLGVEDIPETGLSFIENAILKARHACQSTGFQAFSDDSGLEIDALNGEPGVRSARYAGEDKNFEANIDQVLSRMKHIPESERTARFRCVMVWMFAANHPSPVVFEGYWEGMITFERKGQGGFGYDPIFYVPEQQCTAAELSSCLKNKISHRANALNQLLRFFKSDQYQAITARQGR